MLLELSSSSCPAEVPGIHEFRPYRIQFVDGRDKPGHDEMIEDYAIRTAAPVSSPSRSAERASLACVSGMGRTVVFTGISGASARNSRASLRVRLATERTTRSSQRMSYG